MAHAGVKEPEVGVFEAVFSPDYSFSFAFAPFNFALNKIGGGGGGRSAPFWQVCAQKKLFYAKMGWRILGSVKGFCSFNVFAIFAYMI